MPAIADLARRRRCRALAFAALQGDVAAGLLHETVDHAEAKPGAAAGGLGGEERLEGAALDGLGHALAGVLVGDEENGDDQGERALSQ